MGTEVPVTATNHNKPEGLLELTDDMPLAQRLLILQKKRAAEQLAAASMTANGGASITMAPVTSLKIKPDPGSKVTNEGPEIKSERQGSSGVKIKKDPGVATTTTKKDPAKGKSTVSTARKEEKRTIPSVPVKGAPSSAKKAKTVSRSERSEVDEEGTGEEEYKWWEDRDNDGSVKWTTLEHNGVYFAPEYQPHGVPLMYDGQPLQLEPSAEEVATFFAAILGTDHYDNEIFRRNFWEDFTAHLHAIGSRWHGHIKQFEKCDFTPIATHLAALKEAKKTMSKEEREQLKMEKVRIDEFYGYCLLDGRREKVGNFRMEPPGLFRGRGKHPKAGKLKTRVMPEQVTINIGPGVKVPEPPAGHAWGKVVSDNTVTWLATWTENVNKQQKYVFLAAGSSLKGQSDLRKFETARELNKHVDKIRRVNAEELRSKEMFVRQRATALWLIDRLALRAGNEKGDDEADTVGCCSLRCEHVSLQEPNIVIFDFLGKDSIRYYNEVPVDAIIFKNLSIFMRPPKGPQDPIFDRLTTAGLNKYLNGLMPGLTAKVFRTYNASHTFQAELEKTPGEASVPDLVLSYNRANRQVAILCNHQRAVPKTHAKSMERLSEKISAMKYQRYVVRKELREVMSKKELQSELPSALEAESDMDEETITQERERERQREAEKLEKTKEKGGSASPPSSQSPSKRNKRPSAESLVKKFNSLSTRIDAAKSQRIDRDENKTTALGTSKTNYIDPRITAAWCAKYNVPIEKLFNKTLREKFKWAMSVGAEWRF